MDTTNDSIFQVSVKGLFFNEENKLMMIQEDDGLWEFPGARMQKGENFIECLKRECLEETGLECTILEKQPFIVYPALDREGRSRIMVFFKVSFVDLNFKPSDECVAINFFDLNKIIELPSNPQLKELSNLLLTT